MNCNYYGQYPFIPYPYQAFPSQTTPTTYPTESYKEPETPDPGTICVPIPTEEFGFTCRICAQVKRDNGVYANIYFVIDEAIKVTVGMVSYSQSILDVQFGVVLSVAGFGGSGVGGTFEVKVNTTSGGISACANLKYIVGSVAPWYTMITTLGSVTPAPA